jgi:predicted dehydrogenase
MDAFPHTASFQPLIRAAEHITNLPLRPPIRLGIVGGALHSAVGRTHFIATQMGGDFDIEAGCFSRDTLANSRTASHLRLPPERVFDTPTSLIETMRGRIDALLVLTPTPDHLIQIRQAISVGIPVISEKALTSSVADCLELKEIQSSIQIPIAVTYNYSGYPFVRELRAKILRGDLGRIFKVKIEMPQESYVRHDSNGQALLPQEWRLKDGEIPTVSLDLGVHCHHLISFLTNELPTAEWARHNSLGNFRQVIDDVECAGTIGGEALFSMWFGKAALGHRNGLKIQVYGSEGSAIWVQARPDELHISSSSGNVHKLDFASPDLVVANQQRYMRFKAGHPTGFIEAFANLYDDIAGFLTNLPMPQAEAAFIPTINEAQEGLMFFSEVVRLANKKTN